MAEAAKEPQGIIAILTAPTGEVIATATDFNRSGMGGCKLWEAQMWRARDAVKKKAIDAYSSPVIVEALSGYLLDQVAEALCRKGHKITIRAIGWGDDVGEEMRRH